MVQCVSDASVEVDGACVGHISTGLCVLLGVAETDTDQDAEWMAKKIAGLRVFPDEEGRTNLDLSAVDGKVLLVSQFTLLGDCSKGNRPSFVKAARPDTARRLYALVAEQLRNAHDLDVETGRFQEHMVVSLKNQGPFTVILDSAAR